MNFEWTDEQRDVRDQIDALLKPEIAEDLLKLERAEPDENKVILIKYMKAFAGTGYCDLALGAQKAHQFLRLTAAQERLAQASGSLFVATEVSVRLFGGLLSTLPGSQTTGDLLSRICKGELIGAVAFSGAEDFAAEPDGDGVSISGCWEFVTNGPIADVIAVVVDVNDEPAAFLVRPDDAGVTVGPRLETLGFSGLSVSRVELNQVPVPKKRVLHPADPSAGNWLATIQDLILAQASIGIARRVLETATAHAKTHQPNGKPIIRHQEIGFKLAEMFALLQTMEWYGRRAAWMLSEGDPESLTLVHCAKIFASETCEKIASMAMQVMAGVGYLSGNEAERGYRDAKFAPLAGTTNEVARMAIADDLLKRF